MDQSVESQSILPTAREIVDFDTFVTETMIDTMGAAFVFDDDVLLRLLLTPVEKKFLDVRLLCIRYDGFQKIFALPILNNRPDQCQG
jgi:hypothetical protein